MITKGRDEKFSPEKPRKRGDREIGGLTVVPQNSLKLVGD